MDDKIEPPTLFIEAFGHKKTEEFMNSVLKKLKNNEQLLSALLMIYFLFIIPPMGNRTNITYKFGRQFVNNLELLLNEAMDVELKAIISEKNKNKNTTVH